jgi:Dolichyl-phosphate-mannose-protein mannosyltransferase
MTLDDPPSWRRLALASIVVGTVLVRLTLMVGGLDRLDDPDRYLTLALSLAEGNGFALDGRPTAYRPPLYPIILAPLVAALSHAALPWGVGMLHLALGVGTVLLVRLAARRSGISPVRCLVASAIVAFDPVLAVQSRSVMTETPAAFLIAATLAAVSLGGLKGSFLSGIGFGLASLCRPSLLPAAIVAGLLGLVVRPGNGKTRAIRTGLLGLATVAVLAPWAWRNDRIFGERVWTTTHGGYTLALANNPVYYTEVLDGPAGAVWSGPNQAEWFDEVGRSTDGMAEPVADRLLRSRALSLIRERPWDFTRAALARFGRFWGLAPSGAVYPGWLRAVSAAWTAPLWLFLVLGLANRETWQWPGVVAPAILLALTLVHLAYWTDLRMRAPIVPAIALIVATASPGRWISSSRTVKAEASEAPSNSPGLPE